MKHCKLLLLLALICPVAYGQDLSFATTLPIWQEGTISNAYSNTGTPNIKEISAIFSGDLRFTSNTFPRPSLIGLRTQVNFNDKNERIVFTINFSESVSSLNFNIHGIDRALNILGFIDRVTVTGLNAGSVVNPVIASLSPHALLNGNVIIGVDPDFTSTPTNIVFLGNVTQVVIELDNAPGTISNPTGQEITIGHMSWDSALPVNLVDFSAQKEGSHARLDWTTSSEESNATFNIQRTQDFADKTTIGTVPGAGNSTDMQRYSWSDEAPLTGTSYYRLEQIDYDGTTNHSRWVTLKIMPDIELNIFPNPIVEGFSINSSGDMRLVEILDASGRTLKSYKPQSYYGGLGRLQSGTYLIKAVMADGSVGYKTIIK